LEQENAANLGGQAFWSFGGMFMVDTPMQRRLGVRDSFELAWQDWQGSADWDRLGGDHPEDEWAQKWGRAYVEFAADDKYPWLREQGTKSTPLVGWQNAATSLHAGMATLYHASTCHGVRERASPKRSPIKHEQRQSMASSPSIFAIKLTGLSSPVTKSPVYTAPSWQLTPQNVVPRLTEK